MAQSIPLSIPTSRPILHVVGEEESPAYDAASPRPRSHATVIDDEVMDTVAPLGMAATGLYAYLERLVGKDGTWRISIPELAHIFQQSERYIQEAMNKLIAAGWVQRVEQTNRFGMQVANVWHLPFHRKARTDGGEPTGEPRGEPRTPSEFTPINVVTTRNHVEDTPPLSPNGGKAKRTRAKPLTLYPDDFQVTDEMIRWACSKYGLTEAQVIQKTERFQWWAKSKGQQYADWSAGWRNFMAPKPWEVNGHAATETGVPGLSKTLLDELLNREALGMDNGPKQALVDQWRARNGHA